KPLQIVPVFPLFWADDEGWNHPAARADICQLRERQTRERRANLTVEEQGVKVDQLFRKLHLSFFSESWKNFACRGNALLNQIVAIFQRALNSSIPGCGVGVPTNCDPVATVIVIRLQN